MSSGLASICLRRSASKNMRSDGYTQWPDADAPVSCSRLAAAAAAATAGPGPGRGELPPDAGLARGMLEIWRPVPRAWEGRLLEVVGGRAGEGVEEEQDWRMLEVEMEVDVGVVIVVVAFGEVVEEGDWDLDWESQDARAL